MDANQNNDPTKKTYHKKATGKALETVEKHSQDHELKLFGSCFWYVMLLFSNLRMQRLGTNTQYTALSLGGCPTSSDHEDRSQCIPSIRLTA